MNDKPRVCFLLGAGVSLPAGLPSTHVLTEEIVSGIDRYTRHTDEHFVKRTDVLGTMSWLTDRPLLKDFLERIFYECKTYFDRVQPSRQVTYEDVYNASVQISDHFFLEEYENPLLVRFVRWLMDGMLLDSTDLQRIADLACTYIRDVLAIQLHRAPDRLDHLCALTDAMEDEEIVGCDIFTLNHDVLIERVLESRVDVVDGFGPASGDVADWNPETFDTAGRHFLIKLHGSTDWFRFHNRHVAISKLVGRDPNHAHDADGRLQAIPSDATRCLVGTFNKVLDYHCEPYATLWWVFRRQLSKCGCLIVSGYSFGDKGVNTALVEWLERDPSRRAILLHERGRECLDAARGAISSRADRFNIDLPKFLCDSTWEELRSLALKSS